MLSKYRSALLLGPFVLLAPVWLTGKALFWGTVSLQFLPWRAYAWEILRSGHLPLWNPLSGMGVPLLANYQSGLVYPPNWLLFALESVGGVGWMAWGQTILVAAHLAWAGLGMAMLARKLGLNELAQTVSGMAFGISEYMVARSGFLSINAAAAWLPWVVLSIQSLDLGNPPPGFGSNIRDPQNQVRNWGLARKFVSLFAFNVRRVRWLAACLALQLLAGHAQITWYSLLLTLMWAAGLGWVRVGEKHGLQSANGVTGAIIKRLQGICEVWAHLALALALACGLAAIQLLPTLEYLLQSQRSSQLGIDFALNYSFWPWRFFTLLAPDMFGNPVRGDYWGYGNYWEDAVYIGVLPLILALSAMRQRKPLAKGLFALVALSFLLALGKNTPVFPWLYRWVPTFAMFQAPTRISLWAVFALALLAGIGANTWKRPTGRGLYWSRLATAGSFAVTIGAGIGAYFFRDINLTYLRATALAGMWGLGSGILALTASPDDEDTAKSASLLARVWPGAVVLFVAGDLLVAGWGLNPGIGLSFYTQAIASQPTQLDGTTSGRIYLPPEVEEQLKFKRFMRFDSYQPQLEWSELRRSQLPNLNLLEHLPSANNFDPLLPGRYDRWMLALEELAHKALALNLMAVSGVENIETTGDSGIVYEPIQSEPRYRWVPCALVTQDADSSWAALFSGQFDPDRQVVIEGKPNSSLKGCLEAESDAVVKLTYEHPNQIQLHVHAPSQGWLLLSDTWYPGWQARVDGQDATVWRANYLFRGVQLGAGDHDVVFSYRPLSFYLGCVVSLLATIIFMVALRIR